MKKGEVSNQYEVRRGRSCSPEPRLDEPLHQLSHEPSRRPCKLGSPCKREQVSIINV